MIMMMNEVTLTTSSDTLAVRWIANK